MPGYTVLNQDVSRIEESGMIAIAVQPESHEIAIVPQRGGERGVLTAGKDAWHDMSVHVGRASDRHNAANECDLRQQRVMAR